MHTKTCQVVPGAWATRVGLATLLLSASGCFMGHGASTDLDSGTLDSGPLPADAGPPPADAALPSECTGPLLPERATRSSVMLAGLDGMALPVDEPFDLPVSMDGACFCGELLFCDVSVIYSDTGPAIIDLTTSFCEGSFLCDGCFPQLDGVCRVPALPAGDYRVRMNGEKAFSLTLPVWRSDTGEEQLSFTPAPPEPEGLFCPWETTPIDTPSQLCAVPQVSANTSSTVTLTNGCGGCFDLPADCVVTRQGARLLVEARTRTCDCPVCGACADVCVPVETTCRLPPLPVGTYTVVSGGLELTVQVVPNMGGGELPPAPMLCTVMTR